MRKLLVFALCLIAAICSSTCSFLKNVPENQIDVIQNQTKWAEIYQITLNSYLERDTALNHNIEFIAIDLSTLEYANDIDKNIIITWFELNYVPVKNNNLDGLKAEGLFDGMYIHDGVFMRINNVIENNREIIIEGMKYRSGLGANWFKTIWRINNNGIWEYKETVMTMIS